MSAGLVEAPLEGQPGFFVVSMLLGHGYAAPARRQLPEDHHLVACQIWAPSRPGVHWLGLI